MADSLAIQIIFDLGHGKIKLSQVADQVQLIDVFQTVQAVLIGVASWLQYAEALIVAQRVGTDAVQTGYFTDLIIIFHGILQNVLDLSIIPGFMILLQE